MLVRRRSLFVINYYAPNETLCSQTPSFSLNRVVDITQTPDKVDKIKIGIEAEFNSVLSKNY